MALDGAFLRHLVAELRDKTQFARVDKIYQPSREELVFVLRGKGCAGRLLLSARGNAPRLHLTDFAPENPATPPMFCMLLRKYLLNARLLSVEQLGLDRVVALTFDSVNEMGDSITPKLYLEILGSRSNLIFVGEDGRIVDAVRRSDLENAAARLIQPGAPYTPPTPQGKLDLLETGTAPVLEAVLEQQDLSLTKALSATLDGACPLVCREVAYRTCGDTDKPVCDLSDRERIKLKLQLETLAQAMEGPGTPTLVTGRDGRPLDFTYLPVLQYGRAALTSTPGDYSALLDAFYAAREQADRMRHKSADLLKLLSNASGRISRKLDAQRRDLARCSDRETYRIYGELIKANLHAIPKGAAVAVVQNYYDPELKELKIPLNAALTPAANAQKYFKEYKKSYTAEETLTRLIADGEEELRYLDSVFDALTRAACEADLAEIREELVAGGYLRRSGAPRKKEKLSKPLSFCSSDGFRILVGKNNRQNDQLTLHTAEKNDLWFHVKNIPGSHVILCCAGSEPPEQTMREAACLAAYYSKARESSSVPVDYTPVRRVKKPAGARPGMVIYETNRTVYVTPDAALCRRLGGTV